MPRTTGYSEGASTVLERGKITRSKKAEKAEQADLEEEAKGK